MGKKLGPPLFIFVRDLQQLLFDGLECVFIQILSLSHRGCPSQLLCRHDTGRRLAFLFYALKAADDG